MNPYVIIKLVTGETVMGTVIHEFDESVVVVFPISLRSFPNIKNGVYTEQMMTAEYCSFTEDKEFHFFRKDIVFMKPMKKSVGAMYQKVLEEIYLNPFKPDDSIEVDEEDHRENDESLDTNKKILH